MAKNVKSPLNKTIDFTEEEGEKYFVNCIADSKHPEAYGSDEIMDRTLCGDTFEVLKKLPENFADLVIVDPPYNLEKLYNTTKFKSRSSEDYDAYTRDWLELSLARLKNNGTMYVCCDWQSSIIIGNVLSSFEASGRLKIRNRITWEREKGRGASANWKNCHEDIWFVTKGTSNDYTFNLDAVKMRKKVIAPYKVQGKPKDWTESEEGNFRFTCPSNFWDDISIPFWSMPENTSHPAQKSEKLLAKLILASSNEGEIVFDPFLGSGSSSVAAKKLGRHWCGIEREKRYCEFAEYRLLKAESDKTIQGFENGIFLKRNE